MKKIIFGIFLLLFGVYSVHAEITSVSPNVGGQGRQMVITVIQADSTSNKIVSGDQIGFDQAIYTSPCYDPYNCNFYYNPAFTADSIIFSYTGDTILVYFTIPIDASTGSYDIFDLTQLQYYDEYYYLQGLYGPFPAYFTYINNAFTVFPSLRVAQATLLAGQSYSKSFGGYQSHFTSKGAGTSVWLSDNGVKVYADTVKVIASDSLYCHFKIPDTILNAYYNLYAMDSADDSIGSYQPFFITNIVKITPDTGMAGSIIHFTIIATGGTFSPSDTFVWMGGYSYIGSATYRSPDTLFAKIPMPANGYYLSDLTISNGLGSPFYRPNCFTVVPSDWNISPSTFMIGQTGKITVNAPNTHFTNKGSGTKLWLSQGNLNVIQPYTATVHDTNTLSGEFNFKANTLPGTYDLNISDAIDGQKTILGAIQLYQNGITGITPDSGRAGETLNVTISGSVYGFNTNTDVYVYFSKNGDSLFSAGSVTLSVSQDTLYAYNILIPKNTPPGTYDVNAYGNSSAHWTHGGLGTYVVYTGLSPVFLPNGFTVYKNTLRGFIYDDANHNGKYDAGESGAANVDLIVQPGNILASTDNSGIFQVSVDTGNYTSTPIVPQYASSFTKKSIKASSTGNSAVDSISFGVEYPQKVYDAQIDISAPANARRHPIMYWLTAYNEGDDSVHTTIKFLPDTGLSFDYSDTSIFGKDSSMSGDTIIWSNVNIGARQTLTETRYYTANYPRVPTNTILVSRVWITSKEHDTIPANNYDQALTAITGSFDPNDKEVSPANFIPTSPIELKYTISFQNTGTDTAFIVVVVDTLDPALNIETFRIVASSNKYTYSIDNRVLTVTFSNINLPDSTTNEVKSNGFFKYGIMQDSGMALNSTISNLANIYFDYNLPVATKTVVNTVNNDSFYHNVTTAIVPVSAGSSSSVRLYPNPTNNSIHIDAGKQNIRSVTITDITGRAVYVQQNMSVKTTSVSMATLPQGMYFIKLNLNNGSYISKVIKE